MKTSNFQRSPRAPRLKAQILKTPSPQSTQQVQSRIHKLDWFCKLTLKTVVRLMLTVILLYLLHFRSRRFGKGMTDGLYELRLC